MFRHQLPLYKHSTNTVLVATLRVMRTKYWAKRLVTQTTASISEVATLGLGDTLGRQVTSAEDSTRKTKQFKEAVGENFNFSGHKWEDITVVVIAHNQHWTDAERKSKEIFWMVQI